MPDEGLALLTKALCGIGGTPNVSPVLLAVSGGPDSMAMLWLAARCRDELGIEFHVATVDHGLRAASALEAEGVGHVARSLGLSHRVLRWDGVKPRSNIQETARRARYALLQDEAAACRAGTILTAHHEDDQIETHCLARERGAGDRGLAGMRARRALAPGIDLVRPFLDIAGVRLRETALAAGMPVIHDPSNDDERFARVRLRRALADIGGGERSRCLAVMARHRAACDAADRAIARALGVGGVEVDAFGAVRLAAERFLDLPPGLRPVLLSRIVVAVGGAEHAPSHPSLERLTIGLLGEGAQVATLGGVRIERGDEMVFSREYGRKGPLPVVFADPAKAVSFDGRFLVSLEQGVPPPGGRLVALGVLGRGNAVERTMPVLVDPGGMSLAVPAAIAYKMPTVSRRLRLASRVSWRLHADLPPDDMG